MPDVKLIYDNVSGNPGDVAIGQIELEYMRAFSIDVNPVDPDYSGGDTLVIGGGELLPPVDNPFYRRFRRKGHHLLYAVGLGDDVYALTYLREYRYVSARTKQDALLLERAGGPQADVVPYPANLLEPADSGLDARGMIGLQTSSTQYCDAYIQHFKGQHVLAFPWRRDCGGLMDHDDLDDARRVALGTGGELLPTGLTPAQLMHVISQLDFFVCQTLHGAIWALQSGVNFIVQSYVPKIYYWAKERGLTNRVFQKPAEIPSVLAHLKPESSYPIAEIDREGAIAGRDHLRRRIAEME